MNIANEFLEVGVAFAPHIDAFRLNARRLVRIVADVEIVEEVVLVDSESKICVLSDRSDMSIENAIKRLDEEFVLCTLDRITVEGGVANSTHLVEESACIYIVSDIRTTDRYIIIFESVRVATTQNVGLFLRFLTSLVE